MNSLQRVLIEKIGHDFGFEHARINDENSVILASAKHPTSAIVVVLPKGYCISFESSILTLLLELKRDYFTTIGNDYIVDSDNELSMLLDRAAGLSRALSSQLATSYEQDVNEVLSTLLVGQFSTEVERMIRQRVGQQKFRVAMMDYWGGACAVTGVAVSAVLRASHAKPWIECQSDIERLDVFNGFLLTANLDALFDRFLISFDEQGRLMISKSLAVAELQRLGVFPDFKLRWVTSEHQTYLAYHRARLS